MATRSRDWDWRADWEQEQAETEDFRLDDRERRALSLFVVQRCGGEERRGRAGSPLAVFDCLFLAEAFAASLPGADDGECAEVVAVDLWEWEGGWSWRR